MGRRRAMRQARLFDAGPPAPVVRRGPPAVPGVTCSAANSAAAARAQRVALGIDASLRATGLVAVPSDWGLDWSRVARATIGFGLTRGATETERIRRLDLICEQTLEFAAEHAATDVFVEQYAFSRGLSQAHALGELCGSLKRDLISRAGLELSVVEASAARALLGSFSARGRKGAAQPQPVKDQVHAVLRRAGLPASWAGDEIDAWVAANWGLSGIEGADALIMREVA